MGERIGGPDERRRIEILTVLTDSAAADAALREMKAIEAHVLEFGVAAADRISPGIELREAAGAPRQDGPGRGEWLVCRGALDDLLANGGYRPVSRLLAGGATAFSIDRRPSPRAAAIVFAPWAPESEMLVIAEGLLADGVLVWLTTDTPEAASWAAEALLLRATHRVRTYFDFPRRDASAPAPSSRSPRQGEFAF
jgi:hypothetical protein